MYQKIFCSIYFEANVQWQPFDILQNSLLQFFWFIPELFFRYTASVSEPELLIGLITVQADGFWGYNRIKHHLLMVSHQHMDV